MARDLHMVCNAHIDPVWQWNKDEGAAEAVSTFRVAADLCDQYDGFVFNHNEAVLYQWVEAYEPELFARIQRLVHAKKWHIIGGWYLQPDCNQPSGESFVRQLLVGNRYFIEKFGVKPTTGVNFDVFGHSRGLVQILKMAGYDSYLFCRPEASALDLPDDFQWIGFDGSRILAHRSLAFYNSEIDAAAEKVQSVAELDPAVGMVLWGVGNHGGGASRKDLEDLIQLKPQLAQKGINLIHSTPESYFEALMPSMSGLPEYSGALWHCFTGCYTTMSRIKQAHRQLESAMLATEKMVSHAAMLGLMAYPKAELDGALCDLLLSEFHDALPGTSIQPVEKEVLQIIGHGLEVLSRLRMKALMLLSEGAQPGAAGDMTIMAYNPHPYPLKGTWVVEVHPHRPYWGAGFRNPVLYMDGKRLHCQYEKPETNASYDWRKAISFEAEFKPSSVNVLVCKFEVADVRPPMSLKPENGAFHFKTDELDIVINAKTGLMDKCVMNGFPALKKGALQPLLIHDNLDSWSDLSMYRDIAGRFEAVSPEECAALSGINAESLEPVRVIEDGEVRTVIEALLQCGSSTIISQYTLPKRGTEVLLQMRVYWNERYKMLKLAVPTTLTAPSYQGQTAFGTQEWATDGRETVSQKWVLAHDANRKRAITLINDGTAGSDMVDGELRLTLLRSPLYSAMFSHDPEHIPDVVQDRFHPCVDIGEHVFHFRIHAGSYAERTRCVNREAQASCESPVFLPFTPPGKGEVPLPMMTLSNPDVELVAMKRSEKDDAYILRLFEPSGSEQCTTVSIPSRAIEQRVTVAPFELVTLKLADGERKLTPVSLIEE